MPYLRSTLGKPAAAASLAGFLLFGPSAAFGQGIALACDERDAAAAELAEAVSGDAFLTTAGDEVRLAGILAPAPGEPGAALAAETLAALLRGRAFELAPAGEGRDRYGRMLAHAFVGGAWIQERLLAQGAVRAAPELGAQSCAGRLLSAEEEARTRRIGLWRDGTFAVRSAAGLIAGEAAYAGSFQIAEGIVLSVGEYDGRYFLNFGEDYRTDFTVTIAPGDARNFRSEGFDLEALEGRRIRVRGWLESYNGPNMPIATSAAIEVLD